MGPGMVWYAAGDPASGEMGWYVATGVPTSTVAKVVAAAKGGDAGHTTFGDPTKMTASLLWVVVVLAVVGATAAAIVIVQVRGMWKNEAHPTHFLRAENMEMGGEDGEHIDVYQPPHEQYQAVDELGHTVSTLHAPRRSPTL